MALSDCKSACTNMDLRACALPQQYSSTWPKSSQENQVWAGPCERFRLGGGAAP